MVAATKMDVGITLGSRSMPARFGARAVVGEGEVGKRAQEQSVAYPDGDAGKAFQRAALTMDEEPGGSLLDFAMVPHGVSMDWANATADGTLPMPPVIFCFTDGGHSALAGSRNPPRTNLNAAMSERLGGETPPSSSDIALLRGLGMA